MARLRYKQVQAQLMLHLIFEQLHHLTQANFMHLT